MGKKRGTKACFSLLLFWPCLLASAPTVSIYHPSTSHFYVTFAYNLYGSMTSRTVFLRALFPTLPFEKTIWRGIQFKNKLVCPQNRISNACELPEAQTMCSCIVRFFISLLSGSDPTQRPPLPKARSRQSRFQTELIIR